MTLRSSRDAHTNPLERVRVDFRLSKKNADGIRALVRAGQYPSISATMREALEVFLDRLDAAVIHTLRSEAKAK